MGDKCFAADIVKKNCFSIRTESEECFSTMFYSKPGTSTTPTDPTPPGNDMGGFGWISIVGLHVQQYLYILGTYSDQSSAGTFPALGKFSFTHSINGGLASIGKQEAFLDLRGMPGSLPYADFLANGMFGFDTTGNGDIVLILGGFSGDQIGQYFFDSLALTYKGFRRYDENGIRAIYGSIGGKIITTGSWGHPEDSRMIVYEHTTGAYINHPTFPALVNGKTGIFMLMEGVLFFAGDGGSTIYASQDWQVGNFDIGNGIIWYTAKTSNECATIRDQFVSIATVPYANSSFVVYNSGYHDRSNMGSNTPATPIPYPTSIDGKTVDKIMDYALLGDTLIYVVKFQNHEYGSPYLYNIAL